MKWFVILFVILGAYFWLMLGSANMVMDRTMQLHQQYQGIAEQADTIASGNR